MPPKSKQKQVPPPASEHLLTVEEVAEFLRVTPRAIQRYCQEGQFPGAFKLTEGQTSDWRIPQSGLDAYLKRQRDQA